MQRAQMTSDKLANIYIHTYIAGLLVQELLEGAGNNFNEARGIAQ